MVTEIRSTFFDGQGFFFSYNNWIYFIELWLGCGLVTTKNLGGWNHNQNPINIFW
jgi:hypothetical protein